MKRREPLTNTQLLMFIAIGIFVVMYGAAMIILSGAFLKWKNLVDLLNDNAYLIIIGCALTVVMIGGGINISVGGVIGLTGRSPDLPSGTGYRLGFRCRAGLPGQLSGDPALYRYAGWYVPVQRINDHPFG